MQKCKVKMKILGEINCQHVAALRYVNDAVWKVYVVSVSATEGLDRGWWCQCASKSKKLKVDKFWLFANKIVAVLFFSTRLKVMSDSNMIVYYIIHF